MTGATMSEVSEENVVWEATVDDHTWKAEVRRTGDRQGVLTVKRIDDDQVIYSDTVNLAYDAIFGPDVADVAEWQSLTIEAIDRFNKTGSVTEPTEGSNP
jgi:hypothetical protein